MATAFVYHSRQQAAAALTAAAQAKRDVTLLTPPGAAGHAGPEYLLEMYRSACGPLEAENARTVINCGDDTGLAMRALRCGWRDLVLSARPDTVEKIIDMAGQVNGVVRDAPPLAIDLLGADDPLQVCVQAFKQETDSTSSTEDQR